MRLRAPDPSEEQDALWAAAGEFDSLRITNKTEVEEAPLPHPSHYKDWFAYFDTIDLRRHLQEVEIVLIEAALEKRQGMVSQAADSLN